MSSPPSLFHYQARVVEITSVIPNAGALGGGDVVTIYGRGFVGLAAGTPAVSFGGSAATVLDVQDDSSIRVTTPAHAAGIVDVTVTNTDGGTDTYQGAFTYRATPPPAGVRYKTQSGASASRMRLEEPPPSVTQSIGQPFQATMTVESAPKGLASVQLEAFGVSLFAGVVTSVEERTEGRQQRVVYDIEATDYIFVLSRRFPAAPLEWVDISASQVLADLMLISGEGFRSEIEFPLDKVTLKIDGTKSLWALIVEVCERCGAKAFMIGTTVYVFTVEPNIPFDQLPDDVTISNPDLLWPENGSNPVKVKYDYSQIVTRVFVYGAEAIWTMVEDSSAIALYGYIDDVIVDDTLTTIQELRKLGLTHLDAHSQPMPTIAYSTRDLNTTAGKPVDVDIVAEVDGVSPADTWIQGQFIIQTVKIDQIELVESTPSTKPRFQVTASPYRATMKAAAGIQAIFQKVGDLAAKERQAPRLSGEVTSDPGGKTTIPPKTITNNHLAGCITTDQLRPGPQKDPTVTSTTGAGSIARSGLPTINGVALQEGDRVLVTEQTDPSENGIYVASAATGTWARSTDADEDEQMVPGITVVDANTGTAYYLDATAPVVVGTTALYFRRLAGSSGSSATVMLSFLEDGGDVSDEMIVAPVGMVGPTGGAVGAQGPRGPQGPPGFAIDAGGEDEPAFIAGPTGPAGPAGEDGSAGSAAETLRITSEIATGAVDGSNRTYSTSNDYAHLEVFVNGIFQTRGRDYDEISARQFKMTVAPLAASGRTTADVVTTNYDPLSASAPVDPPDPYVALSVSRIFPPRLDVSKLTFFGAIGTGMAIPTSTTMRVVGTAVSEYVPQGQIGGTTRAFPPSAQDLSALTAGTYSVSVSTNRDPNTIVVPNALVIESWAGNTIKYIQANDLDRSNTDSVEGIILSRTGWQGRQVGRIQYNLYIWGSGFSDKFYQQANAAVTLGDVNVYLSHLGYNATGGGYNGTVGYIAIDITEASLGSKDLVISSPIFASGSVTFVGAITVVA